jgi:elongation factor 3
MIDILSSINTNAVTLILEPIFKILNHRRWEPQYYGLKCILFLSENKPDTIRRNLQEIIPNVSDLMVSSKSDIADLSKETMISICKTSGNNDIEPFVEQIIKSVLLPEEVANCVHSLASTVFVQKVEAPALAVVEPLLMRGLKENKIAMKRKVASIVANMLVLVDDPCDGAPFLERVLPGLEKANEGMTDVEAKGVIQKACNELSNISKQLMDYKGLTPEVITKIIQKECCFENVIDLNTLVINHISNMCSSLVGQRLYKKEYWNEAIVPYFSFTDKASLLCDKVYQSCLKESKPVEEQHDVEEEGEDLCNCQFTLGYAAKVLLSNTRLHLKRGKRYGLCGPNDCGKSTLMRSIANGQLEGFPPSSELKTVYVEHDIQGVEENTPVLDFVFMDPNCQHVTKEEVVEVLESVGFSKTEVSKGASQLMPITSLSGGWKMKLALARAMLAKADILLLDEPTNHLDVDNVQWVKDYLKSLTNVTSIIVSHDSGLMDDVCTHIIHFENKKLVTYIGNLKAFVEKVPEAQVYYEFKSQKLKFIFPEPTILDGVKSKGKPILMMSNVSYTYPGFNKQVLNDVSVKCTLGSRIAVIGPNGAGKSTAIKALTGEIIPTNGTVWKHPNMRFAYVAQHAFHHLEEHLDKTPAEYILWRYSSGFDKELAYRNSNKITEEDKAIISKPIKIMLEEGGKMVEKKLVVERIVARRKKKSSYEYEVKWQNLPDTSNAFLAREKLEELGFHKLINLCDEQENSRMSIGNKPCTKRFVIEQLGELGLETEYAGHVQIGNLSGGQKVKVVLAAAMWGKPHLIILDEPTNYLDRDSLAALADAIRSFEGGIVLISHNRDFVEHVCKTLWIMADGVLRKDGEEETDEKIVHKEEDETTTDAFGNTVVNKKEKTLTKSEIKKMKKIVSGKIKNGETLTEDEENFCIEHNL